MSTRPIERTPRNQTLSQTLRRTVSTLLLRASGWTEGNSRAPHNDTPESILRAELFSADQMERHGKTLAQMHRISAERGGDRLLMRLGENEAVLQSACTLLLNSVRESRRITPAGEWLLDNFYLVEEQIRTARAHFSKRYGRELPVLASGPSQGLARVYDIALEVIAHGDGRVDPENLNRFVAAYQSVSELKLGELWAIPIMLRLALIENLRRISVLVSEGMVERNRASVWADEMLQTAENDPKSLILVISDMARSSPTLANSFVAELARRLQGHSSALALPLTWIEQSLAEMDQTIEQMVQSETQSQAINQVCIGNSIASLRLLSATDWRDFVESMSTVERTLREDPEGVYGLMDFSTRDRYRHVVEKVARQSSMSESDVARKAVQLAHHALANRNTTALERPAQTHVGYYLIDAGRPVLERAVQANLGTWGRLQRRAGNTPVPLYLGAVALLTAALSWLLLRQGAGQGLAVWQWALVVPAAALATSQLAVTVVNWLATQWVTPHLLPRMNFAKGIAPDARTLVVVPTLLGSASGVAALIEALEVRYLSNQDPYLHFGLLTDLPDAPTETQATDAALVDQASAGIAALNLKYPGATRDTFFLFHRPRLWNPQERVWMAYERKRGKLGALNALLRGHEGHGFTQIVGNTAALQSVRYVITLDTDTQLQRDTARSFAAAMAHPLNQPHFDTNLQRVTAGYGILQPRMAVSLESTNRSRYARLLGSEAGVDPYTRAVSDVYQDLFHEGSFIGKGIYDVDAFELALKDRFPENRILSHDLLEGCYARAGLLSDVQLYDDYPARYDSDVSRRSRWMRGDWQIASWLQAKVPDATPGKRQKNPLSLLSHWKILDNLRRSLVPPALVLLLLTGWFALPDALAWMLATLGLLVAAPLGFGLMDLLHKPEALPWALHARGVLHTVGKQLAQAGLALALLPFEAGFSLMAIARTHLRVGFTHHRLLEWQASHAAPGHAGAPRAIQPGSLADLLRTTANMSLAPLLAIGTALVLAYGLQPGRSGALAPAMPVLLAWLLAPALAWWISRPLVQKAAVLDAAQTIYLRMLARKTWAFFEQFVTAADHWLAPDNYQEHPVAVLAHRTSPTNMGLSLLANVTAHDFGFISTGTLMVRTTNSLNTMQRMERHAGHFYNWYDTTTLAPLLPRYVSTVDSGNLSGHLLTLRPALLGMIDQPVLNARAFEGLQDAMGNLNANVPPQASAALVQALAHLTQTLESACAPRPARLDDATARLVGIEALCTALLRLLETEPGSRLSTGSGNANAEVLGWTQALFAQCRDLQTDLDWLQPFPPEQPEAPGKTVPTLRTLAAQGSAQAAARMAGLEALADQSAAMARADYQSLYDATRHLLVVGYNVDDNRRDTGHYDLLASEARLCSFVAIAQGDIPQDNWFALGRLLTQAGDTNALLSWSGSMFEYLMPNLVMPLFANTLLDQTCHAVVRRQIAYGEQRGVPWGISESGFNTVDAALNYQYRAFGVPGLGLKRGLAEDLVVAPYATALALMVLPQEACRNLQRLSDAGFEGQYGMYEAIDYTPSRVKNSLISLSGQSGQGTLPGACSAVVRSFMAHHQGMSLLSFSHVLLDQPMPRRFASDPLFQATMLLLQERIPNAAVLAARAQELPDARMLSIGQSSPMRVLRNPDSSTPEVHLLSNGRYHVMVSQSGAGYSRWKDLAVTRWREDGTRDHWGAFCYLRDVESGNYWSAAHQPTLQVADHYEAIFSEGRAEFRRRDHDFETYTELVVSPEDDMELRRTRITNRARTARTIEITSYAEVVLAPPAADSLHPAFSNLFVQTEIVRDRQAILCHRRPRSASETTVWLYHLMAVHGADAQTISYETDRKAFTGRTRSTRAPQAMEGAPLLGNSEGPVLDPIVAIRQRITLQPQQTVTVDMVTGVAELRDTALALVDKYRDIHLADRVFDLATTHAWVNLQQINATQSDAQLFARLAGSVIYANPAQRAQAVVLARNRRGQSSLWGYGVSGDLPIVLLQISSVANIELVRQLVQAHAYWRLKGLAVDLVIWNEDHAGYRQALQEQILGLIAAGIEANLTDRPGGIFVRSAEHMPADDRTLFQTVARVIITDTRGTLQSQANRHLSREAREMPAPLLPVLRKPAPASPQPPPPGRALQFFNGLGGFSQNGREYIITTTISNGVPQQTTPMPWVNVLANARFGTVVSESGSAYTWSENAHEFRYTPWSNDAVSDGTGEAIYLRDEETGAFWSPTTLPCGGDGHFVTRHGFGYSVFEHTRDGIATELTLFVDQEAAIKFSKMVVRNVSGRTRKLSATGYVEWVLGDLTAKSAMHVSTEVDPHNGAILARNPYNPEFGDRMAFFDADGATRASGVTFTGDRREFLGRNGSLHNPAAMHRTHLSNRVGAGLDPCAAVQIPFELAAGEDRVVIFRLGAAGRRGLDDARVMVQHLREAHAQQDALESVQAYWEHTLSSVQVQTPDVALNLLSNGWLLYQTMACRLWARTGFYQSGGAYGFRDQLQDTMALVHAAPALLREHLLRCAARQFAEGDVQHWWHPPQGRGVRTNCSDDYLWLAQGTCRYVLATGDTGVLLETQPFLTGRALNPEEDSYYDLPGVTDERATLYEHCVRAIRHGLRKGAHGLPLMGSGDWNDGMNLVGLKGTGESVWLAFFLFDTLVRFSPLARSFGDTAFADQCLAEAELLRSAIAQHGWDGEDGAWYRRAYFDDGTPLGSAANAQCQIDSVTQSWAVLSGAGEPERNRSALNALDTRLVRRELGLIQLLTPPFNQTTMNPGYIAGYLPGVRENGGQYTHAAIWAVMAFAESGDPQRAWECFDLINPVRHGSTPQEVATYQVEPYVVAADVYAVEPHQGHGGWSWYTGSASWMYRLITESLLGMRLEAGALHFKPCLPAAWEGFTLDYRFGSTTYGITVQRTTDSAHAGVVLDGVLQAGSVLTLQDDGVPHKVRVSILV